MKHLLFYLITSIFISQSSLAATVRGIVSDAKSNEQIIGGIVFLKGTSLGAASGLDGSYVVKNVPVGSYELVVSYVGYKSDIIAVTIKSDGEVKEINSLLFEENTNLNEVVIEGSQDKTTDEFAARSIQNSLQVVNIVSAKTIEVSPDLTVANVLQRVSGVTIERNQNGDGQHAIIRGMDKRYNYTLVNGIKIPSPDSKNRYVPLDIFPSDLLDRLEVSKSLTPNMEGDAIGGVINMIMKDAPSRLTINANAGTGYGQLFFDRPYVSFDRSGFKSKSPAEINGSNYVATPNDFSPKNLDFKDVAPAPNAILGFSIGNRFLNNKLGAIVAASYQNTYRGSDSKLFEERTTYDNNALEITDVVIRRFSAQQIRSGVHAKLDYKFSPSQKLSFFSSYINLVDVQSRISSDTNLVIERNGAGTGRGSNKYRSRVETQNILTNTLQGNHSFFTNQLKLQWSAVYSLASYQNPDQSIINASYGQNKDVNGNIVPLQIPIFNDAERRWERNSDQDKALYINLNYLPSLFGQKFDFSIGGLQRFKNRENFYNIYFLRPNPTAQENAGTNLTSFSYDVFNPTGTTSNALNYTAYENVTAGYGMVKTDVLNVQIIGGIRAEFTDFGWNSKAPVSEPGKTGTNKYLDVLPSLHFKYALTPKSNLRASYYASISRPGFFEVIPYRDKKDDFSEAGNPFLKRTQADNFDLRYELFPKPLNQLLIGAFYKIIKNPIEYSFVTYSGARYLQPSNFGTATNYGLEVDFTHYFRIFGIRANYTFTNSEIITLKTFRYTNEAGVRTERQENQIRPLQGQSMHCGNLSLLLKDQKSGFDAQLAMVYTGDRIVRVSNYKDGDFWQKGFVQLDFSAEKRIMKYLTAYIKINNILNTPYEVVVFQSYKANSSEAAPFQKDGEDFLIQKDYYGQTYLAGLRFKL